MLMADTWRTVWHGAQKSHKAAGRTDDVTKRFLLRVEFPLKVIVRVLLRIVIVTISNYMTV